MVFLTDLAKVLLQDQDWFSLILLLDSVQVFYRIRIGLVLLKDSVQLFLQDQDSFELVLLLDSDQVFYRIWNGLVWFFGLVEFGFYRIWICLVFGRIWIFFSY